MVAMPAKQKKNGQLLLLAIGVVLVWRGLWGLIDIYLFPNNAFLSHGLSLIIGLAILYANDRKLSELL